MAIHYRFRYICKRCAVDAAYTYRVPDSDTEVLLTCKLCERVVLKIRKLERRYGVYYTVEDPMRGRTIIDDKKGDAFWGWVVDHGGEREDLEDLD